MGIFNSIPEIIEELKKARMVIVVDDEDRENEGDLVMPACFVEPKDINFMAKYGRGLICVALEEERLRELNIGPMFSSDDPRYKRDPFSTAWMVSVDSRFGITTGISAFDRAHTIKVLIDPKARPEDLIRPGHIFPLKAQKGGVLVRAGHTEASVDLMRLAGLYPAGVICEIMNEDGSMARLPELLEFSKRHNLKICSIADLIEYRRRNEKLIEKITEIDFPTEYGRFRLILYKDLINQEAHLALVMGNPTKEKPTLVRVHSQCLTGDVFGSLRCDCGKQLKKAMQVISQEGEGILLYMNQEGRGIGLFDKIRAYKLQEEGLDTVDANKVLGYQPDLREYGIGAQILVDLGVTQIRLLTNNPRKIVGLEGYGLKIVERLPLEIEPNPINYQYLKTKKQKLGHNLNLID